MLSLTVKTSAVTGNEYQMTDLTGEGMIVFEDTNYSEKYHTLSQWGCHLSLVPSDGRGFNGRAEQLSPVTDK